MIGRNGLIAAALLVCAAATLVFVDGLEAVGRYDAGIKRLILLLAYGSIPLTVCAVPLLRRGRITLALVAVAFGLFIPLFVHECVPCLISFFDPAYTKTYGEGGSVPLLRFDAAGVAAFFLFILVLALLLTRRRRRDGSI